MRDVWPSVKDGLVTGAVLAGLLTLPCPLLGRPLGECGGWIFQIGALLALLSAVWTIIGYDSPPGLVGLWSGKVEVYPTANEDSLWLDRFICPRNVWLVAGMLMTLIAFLPPFLGL